MGIWGIAFSFIFRLLVFNKNRCVPLPERKSTSEWLEPVAQKHPKHPTEVRVSLTFLTLKNEIKLSSAGICFRHDNKNIYLTFLLYLQICCCESTGFGDLIHRFTGILAPKHVCFQLCSSARNVSCGCPPTVASTSPPQRHPFAVNLVMFSANSLLFLRINKPILKGWLQPNFRKRRKKKVWGRKIFGCPPAH